MNNRQKRLLDLLREHRFMTVSTLAEILHYSPSTIRRDLNVLEKTRLVQRTAGGALAIQEKYIEAPQSFKQSIHRKEKRYIANLAMEYISEYNSLFLDSSSTSSIVARTLSNYRHLTVITPNLCTALEIEKNTDNMVYTLGGRLQDVLCNGVETNQYAADFLVDIAFISCRGLVLPTGIYDQLENEAKLKQTFRDQAKKVVLLIDHHKFDHKYLFRILPLIRLDAIVTDEKPAKKYIDCFEKNNIELVY